MNWLEFAISILEPLLDALVPLAALVIGDLIRRHLRDNGKSAAAAAFLTRLNTSVWDAVLETQQTAVAQLKADAEDGKLTAAEAKRAGNQALDTLKSFLGERGIAEAREILGRDDAGLDVQLRRMIEAKVASLKLGR